MKISLDKNAFTALNSLNFRRYLYVQVISVIGFFMQDTAMSWIVYEITGNSSSLGIVGVVTKAPVILLTFIIGAWLDNSDYRKVIIATQIMATMHAAALAALVFTGQINYTYIVLLAAFYGLVNAVYWPARQASVAMLVDQDKDLKSAISIYSCLFNLAKLLGPSVAGWVIYKYGALSCFLFNALSYIPVIYIIYITTFRKRKKEAKKQNALKGMIEGFSYVKSFKPLRTVIIFFAFICFFNAPIFVLFPAISKDIMGKGAEMYGYLQGGIGLGAIIGAVFLSGFVKLRTLPYSIAIAGVGLGLLQCWFASVAELKWLWLSIFITVPIGFCNVSMIVGTNTLMQSVADDDKRSRVISFYAICLNGLPALGMYCCGLVADKIGPVQAMTLFGVAITVVAVIYLFNAPRVSKVLSPIFDGIEKA